MLLKCRYLAQFSVPELAKYGAIINQAQVRCPFMAHATRTLATTTTPVAQELNPATHSTKTTPTDKAACSNTSSCQYYTACRSKSVVQEKNFKDLVDCSAPCENCFVLSKPTTSVTPNDKPRKQEENRHFDYEAHFAETIAKKKKDGSYRNFKKVIRSAATFPNIQVSRLKLTT